MQLVYINAKLAGKNDGGISMFNDDGEMSMKEEGEGVDCEWYENQKC